MVSRAAARLRSWMWRSAAKSSVAYEVYLFRPVALFPARPTGNPWGSTQAPININININITQARTRRHGHASSSSSSLSRRHGRASRRSPWVTMGSPWVARPQPGKGRFHSSSTFAGLMLAVSQLVAKPFFCCFWIEVVWEGPRPPRTESARKDSTQRRKLAKRVPLDKDHSAVERPTRRRKAYTVLRQIDRRLREPHNRRVPHVSFSAPKADTRQLFFHKS